MTTTPPAWHPDPSDTTRLRWHDGLQWTEHTTLLRRRPPLGAHWPLLGIGVQVALALTIVVDLATIAVDIWSQGVLAGWLRDPASASVQAGERIDSLNLAAVAIRFVFLVVTGVLFIAWLYRAHRSDRMDPAFLQHGSGWTIGGWFVPILNLWRPRQMVADVQSGARRDRTAASGGLLDLWWLGLLLTWVLGRVSTAVSSDSNLDGPDAVETLQLAIRIDAVAAGLDAVVAVLAIVLVRRLTTLVRDARPV